jgi:UDP-glucuronate decarboxylase
MQKNILVTGGAGNVGSALIEKLIQNENNFVIILDDLSTGFRSKLPKEHFDRWHFIKCNVNDLQDIGQVMISHKFDYVFHFAAVVGVQRTHRIIQLVC